MLRVALISSCVAVAVLLGVACASNQRPPAAAPELGAAPAWDDPATQVHARAIADSWAREDAEAERRLRERAADRSSTPSGPAVPASRALAEGPGVAPNSEPVDEQAPTLDPDQPMPEGSVSTRTVLALGQESAGIIDARSDIYSAGADVASQPRDGVLPAQVRLAPGGGFIVLRDVRGLIGCIHGSSYGPDGGSCAGGDTRIDSADSISGIVLHGRTLFVTGVFLGEGATPRAKPLDFSKRAFGTGFESLSPALGQTFFIGDGLTGTGSGHPQQFQIPPRATHLYLGFADASAFHGEPGCYGDNTGSIALRITQKR